MADMKFLDTFEEVLLERGFPLNIVQSVLKTVQTIDAVEVVRCRECKHFKIGEDNVYYCRRDKLGRGIFMRKSDFCSYGERKDGDGNAQK